MNHCSKLQTWSKMACFYFHSKLISILSAQTSCLASDSLLFLFAFKNYTKVPSIYLCSVHWLYFSIHYFFYWLKRGHRWSSPLCHLVQVLSFAFTVSITFLILIVISYWSPLAMSLLLFNHFISSLITVTLATSPVSSISSTSSLFTLLLQSHSF